MDSLLWIAWKLTEAGPEPPCWWLGWNRRGMCAAHLCFLADRGVCTPRSWWVGAEHRFPLAPFTSVNKILTLWRDLELISSKLSPCRHHPVTRPRSHCLYRGGKNPISDMNPLLFRYKGWLDDRCAIAVFILEGIVFVFNGSRSRMRTGQVAGLAARHHLASIAACRRNPVLRKEQLRDVLLQDEQGFFKVSHVPSQWKEFPPRGWLIQTEQHFLCMNSS